VTARRTVEVLVVAVLAGVGALLVGLPGADAAVVALAVAVVTIVVRSLDEGGEHPWTDPVPDPPDGARPAVSVLMWSFAGRDGKVSEAALRHLRRQAARRLAVRGIALEDADAARGALGDRAWSVLAGRGALPTLPDVAHCIHVVEGLTPDRHERHP